MELVNSDICIILVTVSIFWVNRINLIQAVYLDSGSETSWTQLLYHHSQKTKLKQDWSIG